MCFNLKFGIQYTSIYIFLMLLSDRTKSPLFPDIEGDIYLEQLICCMLSQSLCVRSTRLIIFIILLF